MMKFFLLLTLISASCIINAQSLLTPSKKSFDKKWVKNSNYKMTWYALKDTAQLEMGEVTTQIVADKVHLTVVTQVNMKNMKTPFIDSTVADLETLAPIRHSSYSMPRDMVLNFGKVVTGFYNDKMKKTNTLISDTTISEYFDSNLYPVLIGWLPLTKGYTQDISIYDYNPSAKIGILKASIKDVTSGVYQSAKNGTRDVWIVTVTDEIGNHTSTYYFGKVDRKLWKQEVDLGSYKILMKLVES